MPRTRARRSSSIKIQHMAPDSQDVLNDQDLQTNLNANWINFKGAWVIHFVIIGLVKVFYTLILKSYGLNTAELNWTLTNLTYTVGSYIMFHQVKGTPFEFNLGAYDKLTMWEQLDNGDQYTPAKKFLMGMPIALFLCITHFTNYSVRMSIFNGACCLLCVIPKLELSHRLRVSIPYLSEYEN
ncbi:hypothetical protein BABINDRAFT_42535 [Babjeviella inositovora NRRL Y-12698]|uniref:Protein ORM1 n=1 Tax=Babjeviella inositovora NRRL Y-12698 TaxID=984486 RepID=A0A1E3QGY4_9ASCO|nr:uncharacterized protein BABINDRAFT_42535 [Babjeviella inositovora NRRL Y-12698]ODQ76955.1 hypothetical protein BABINDRAFT_42535 [Babjeviella inositovora NRRL Y-12698]